QKGDLKIDNQAVHRIVATAFLGDAPTKNHIVYHIDSNKKNNKPYNLRWVTKLENAVLNPNSRKRIEYQINAKIYEFLKEPFKYMAFLENPRFNWLSRITEEEGLACLETVREIERSKAIQEFQLQKLLQVENGLIDSLTPLAKQRNWKTPTRFPCCPEKVEREAINCYLKNLSGGTVFSANQYGESLIVKCTLVDNCIYLITTMASGPKGWAVAKITFENGYYLHESLGSFFTDEGAEKRFTLAQGLEWTGGDTFDDYC
ncbi:MAG: HNH endonuclease, partial [Clostridia bacterium]|nr:HNH endonuclease [Clostridia bacterium]